MCRHNIWDVYVIYSAQKCCSYNHEDEHEPVEEEKHLMKATLPLVSVSDVRLRRSNPEIWPHHVIDHSSHGYLQGSQGFVGRQNVGETCETQHAGHGKESLCNQLRILLFPVLSYCSDTWSKYASIIIIVVVLNELFYIIIIIFILNVFLNA